MWILKSPGVLIAIIVEKKKDLEANIESYKWVPLDKHNKKT